MKAVLITGATGFIGNALTRFYLKTDTQIHVMVRLLDSASHLPPQVKIHVIDGSLDSVLKALENARPDVVFHLASLFLASHQPSDVGPLITSNVLFGTQLLEAMALTGCKKMINTGTSWQHYATQDYRPVNLYAATKQAFEDIIDYYHLTQGLSCITLKLFDTYGPGDPRRKLVSVLMEAAYSREALEMSPGDQIIDISYIDDVVAAFAQAAKLLEGGCAPVLQDYFVSGERLSLRKLVDVVGQAMGREIDVRFGGRPYREREIMHPVVAGERQLPGWSPRYRLSDGVRLLVRASETDN